MRVEIKDVFSDCTRYENQDILVEGWIRNLRSSKNVTFIELNDGSTMKNIQIVVGSDIENYEEISKLQLSSTLRIHGTLIITPQSKQAFEIQAKKIEIEGASTNDYPLQKKRHTFEYLRTLQYLRPRTNTFNAVFRVRSVLSFALHKFFNERGFVYVHTPIITSSDAEGAGEMFQVTSLDLENIPRTSDKTIDYSQDFFGKKANLTVSGQLEVEGFAMAYGKVYTFGPTFRAENSNTPRHAAEFWMVEPEICFAELEDVMMLAEDMVKYIIHDVLANAPNEMEFFNKFVDKDLFRRLELVEKSVFKRMTYTEAIEELHKAKVDFKYPVHWGADLQTEHERYISEQVVGGPVFITDYPKDIKSFYMRLNDDGRTVAACDLLVPGIGELVGGSQREERVDVLKQLMQEKNIHQDDYEWYLNLRRYGTVKHGGFGLGFERALMYITGMSNIRDVLPYPRTVHSAGV